MSVTLNIGEGVVESVDILADKIFIKGEKNWVVVFSLAEFNKYCKVICNLWTDWIETQREDMPIKYKTNGRIVFVKTCGVKAKATCHKEELEEFSLDFGIALAFTRCKEKLTKKFVENLTQMSLKDLNELVYNKSKESILNETSTDVLDLTTKVKMSPREESLLGNSKNLKGKRFGSLVVQNLVEVDKSRHRVWLCKCDCGKELKLTSTALTTGRRKGCCKKCEENLKQNNKPLEIIETIGVNIYNVDDKYKRIIAMPTNLNGIGISQKIFDENQLSMNCKELSLKDSIDLGNCHYFNKNIFVLFTKNDSYEISDLYWIRKAMRELAFLVYTNNVEYLVMPKLFCGKEKRDWYDIKKLIREEFTDIKNIIENTSKCVCSPVQLLVCM
jgi:hypothetical protein